MQALRALNFGLPRANPLKRSEPFRGKADALEAMATFLHGKLG